MKCHDESKDSLLTCALRLTKQIFLVFYCLSFSILLLKLKTHSACTQPFVLTFDLKHLLWQRLSKLRVSRPINHRGHSFILYAQGRFTSTFQRTFSFLAICCPVYRAVKYWRHHGLTHAVNQAVPSSGFSWQTTTHNVAMVTLVVLMHFVASDSIDHLCHSFTESFPHRERDVLFAVVKANNNIVRRNYN